MKTKKKNYYFLEGLIFILFSLIICFLVIYKNFSFQKATAHPLCTVNDDLNVQGNLSIQGDVSWTGILTSGSVPWGRLTAFPIGCGAGQAVQAIGTSLTCVTLPSGGISCSDCDARFINATTSDTMEGDLSFRGDTRRIGTSDNNDFIIKTNNQDRITILSNGNIGIGTSTANKKLQIAGDVNLYGNLFLKGGDRDIEGDQKVKIKSAGLDVITILPTGYVGIRTTTPSTTLVVQGSSWITGHLYDSEGNQGTPGAVLTKTATGQVWENPSSTIWCPACDDRFVNATGDTMTGDLFFRAPGRKIKIGTTNHYGIKFIVSSTIPVMTLTTSTRVGIGTTTPAESLHSVGYIRSDEGFCIGTDCRTSWPISVSGAGTPGYVAKWISTSTLADSIIQSTSSYVGIGISPGTYRLQVKGITAGANEWTAKFTSGGPGPHTSYVYLAKGNGPGLLVDTDRMDDTGYYLAQFSNTSGVALYIRGDRKVGIRTTNPSEELTVSGDIKATNDICSATKCLESALTSESDPQVDKLTPNKWCKSDAAGSAIDCDYDLPSESDPQVGTLMAGKWCTSDGSKINCTSANPDTTVDGCSGCLEIGSEVKRLTKDYLHVNTFLIVEEELYVGVSANNNAHFFGNVELHKGDLNLHNHDIKNCGTSDCSDICFSGEALGGKIICLTETKDKDIVAVEGFPSCPTCGGIQGRKILFRLSDINKNKEKIEKLEKRVSELEKELEKLKNSCSN